MPAPRITVLDMLALRRCRGLGESMEQRARGVRWSWWAYMKCGSNGLACGGLVCSVRESHTMSNASALVSDVRRQTWGHTPPAASHSCR
jgi:hypothetical protein